MNCCFERSQRPTFLITTLLLFSYCTQAILDTVVHADGPHAARTAREARAGGSLGEGVCESLERLDTSLIIERLPTPNASASSSSPVSNSRDSEEEAELDHLGFNEEDAAWSELAMGNWPGAEGEFGGGMDGSSAFPI